MAFLLVLFLFLLKNGCEGSEGYGVRWLGAGFFF